MMTPPVPSSEQLDVHPPVPREYKILLIDDNPDHQMLGCKALQTLGKNTSVTTVATAVEGLRALEEQEFELVIADYRMPEMDGLELLGVLNQRRINVPVVIVTGLGNERVAVRALKEGAHDYVIKESGYLELLPSIAERAITAFRTRHQLEDARRQLAESEERYRRLVHGLDAIVWEADPITWRYTFVSQRAEDILGYPVERWLNDPFFWLNLIHSDDREQTLERCRLTTADRRDNEFEFRAVAADGAIVWLRDIVRLTSENGQVTSLCGLMVDITKSKKMEEELLKAQKLESIGLLAGGIAHDFNNILMAIWGNISLARMDAPPDSRIFERLTAAEKANRQATELTQQLLTFSKGGAPIKRTASIAALIRDSAEFVLRGSNVRCELLVSDDLCPVEVDEGQISQVINNLIINADQAMPEGGVIQVRAENVILEDPSPGPPLKRGAYIRLTIADQGIGIRPEHISRIFDPYFTTKQKGSGLGLATAYSVIKKHDGYICVDSKLGVGTTFTVYLPAAERKIPQGASREEKSPAGRGKILVMDDEESVRDVVGQMLAYIGYEADFARDGAEAIEKYAKAKESVCPFDAVIADLTIAGGMGGKEAIRKLLEFDPNTKAIVSSGYSNNPIMAHFKEYGFSGVVAKPYEIERLGLELQRVIHG